MKIKVKISTQFYENKAYYEGGESWRPKGEFTFFTYIDSMDATMYDKEFLIHSITELVKTQNTDAERFVYRSHELIFQECEIDSEELLKIMDKRETEKI